MLKVEKMKDRINIFLLFLTLVTCVLTEVLVTDSSKQNDKSKSDEEFEEFVPTNEWQEVKKGQAIPKGLHIRMNLLTGNTEAKLLDESGESEKNQVTALSKKKDKSEAEIKTEDDKIVDKIKESILNIDKEDLLTPSDQDVDTVRQKFRSYEELKEKFQKLNMSVKTDLEIMNELFKKYRSESTIEEDTKLSILTDLEFMVHQFDNALEFIRLGGLKDILPELNSTSSQIRSIATHLIGSAAQSNPKVQIALLEGGVIPVLLKVIVLDPDINVKSRALFALSCLVRNFPTAQFHFLEEGGLSVFGNIFAKKADSDVLKLQVKIATLINDLIQERNNAMSFSDEQSNERIRQYALTGLESKLVEFGWCNKLSDLLTSQVRTESRQMWRDDLSSALATDIPVPERHDIIEKVASAMLNMKTLCYEMYERDVNLWTLLLNLKQWYSDISLMEQDTDDKYFSGLADIFSELTKKNHVKDEL